MKKLWKKILRWWYQEDLKKLAKSKYSLLTKEDVQNVLAHLNKTDPSRREADVWDKKFIELIPFLHHYDEALIFLNRYGYVCETYFRHLGDISPAPESNYELQKKLCTLEYNEILEKRVIKYENLLFWFRRSYKLFPELQKEIFVETGDLNFK